MSKRQLYSEQHRRVFWGVHTAAEELSLPSLVRAARLVLPPDAYATGPTALALRGVRYLDVQPLWFASASRVRRADLVMVRDVHADEISGGIAPLGRAIGHLARRARPVDLLVACDQVVHVGLLDVESVHGLLARMQRTRHLAPLVALGAHSPRETRLRLVVELAGLPAPQPQLPVPHDAGVDHVDLGFEEWKVALEYEGAQHLTDEKQWVRDIQRYERLTSAGWLALRITREDLRDPAALAQRIYEALVSRGYVGRPPSLPAFWVHQLVG